MLSKHKPESEAEDCTGQDGCSAVQVLKTKLDIGIVLLMTIVSLLGVQTVYQIPALKEYTNEKIYTLSEKVAENKAEIIALKKVDEDLEERLNEMKPVRGKTQDLDFSRRTREAKK